MGDGCMDDDGVEDGGDGLGEEARSSDGCKSPSPLLAGNWSRLVPDLCDVDCEGEERTGGCDGELLAGGLSGSCTWMRVRHCLS